MIALLAAACAPTAERIPAAPLDEDGELATHRTSSPAAALPSSALVLDEDTPRCPGEGITAELAPLDGTVHPHLALAPVPPAPSGRLCALSCSLWLRCWADTSPECHGPSVALPADVDAPAAAVCVEVRDDLAPAGDWIGEVVLMTPLGWIVEPLPRW